MGRRVLKYALCIIVCVLLAGCTTTKVVTVPEYHYHDSVQVRTHVDSIYLHDSVLVSTSTRNDTVTVERYVTRYRDRVQMRIDTLFVTRVDTVTREVQASVKAVEHGKAATWLEVLLVIGAVFVLLYSIKRSINLR